MHKPQGFELGISIPVLHPPSASDIDSGSRPEPLSNPEPVEDVSEREEDSDVEEQDLMDHTGSMFVMKESNKFRKAAPSSSF